MRLPGQYSREKADELVDSANEKMLMVLVGCPLVGICYALTPGPKSMLLGVLLFAGALAGSAVLGVRVRKALRASWAYRLGAIGDQRMLLYALTWPAHWLERRGLFCSPHRYRTLIADRLDAIRAHGDHARYSAYFPSIRLLTEDSSPEAITLPLAKPSARCKSDRRRLNIQYRY